MEVEGADTLGTPSSEQMNRLMCTSSRSGRNAWVTSSWWKGLALPPPPGNLVSQLGVRCQAAHESTSAKLNWLNTLGTAE
eukprot:1495179-Pyramimonas_sp.AAC.1